MADNILNNQVYLNKIIQICNWQRWQRAVYLFSMISSISTLKQYASNVTMYICIANKITASYRIIDNMIAL